MVGDDSLCLVLDLKSRLGVTLVIGLRVPNSKNRIVILLISLLHLRFDSFTYLGGRDGTVLVDDISQKECLCVPLLD